jgi:hypothetical protein
MGKGKKKGGKKAGGIQPAAVQEPTSEHEKLKQEGRVY